jgi:hypothetical protein
MSVYRYIAETNPNESNSFCINNGYPNATSIEELTMFLQDIVAQNGKSALKDIMELHPDKAVIIELFQVETIPMTEIKPPTQVEAYPEQTQEEQSQPEIIELQPQYVQSQAYMNADGSKIAINTNAAILVGALLVSIAIISMNKS